MRVSFRSALLLPVAILILLIALAGHAGAQPPVPVLLPADAPLASDMATYAPLPLPSGYTAFDGAAAFSVEDASGALYVSAYGKMDGVWGERVFRCTPSCTAVDLGVVPSARGSLSMEPGGLYLTVWDAKKIYRIRVPGAEPWPPVLVQPQIAFPLIGQR